MKFLIERNGDKFTLYNIVSTNFEGDAKNWIAEHENPGILAETAKMVARLEGEDCEIEIPGRK